MRAVPIWKIDRIMLDLDGTAALLFEDAHDKQLEDEECHEQTQ